MARYETFFFGPCFEHRGPKNVWRLNAWSDSIMTRNMVLDLWTQSIFVHMVNIIL